MPTFFTDSASFNNVQVTGSTLLSGSGVVLRVVGSGSTIFSISGSSGEIFSISDSGSSTNVFSVSSGSTTILQVDSSKNVSISGSLIITGSVTSSLLGTASYALKAEEVITTVQGFALSDEFSVLFPTTSSITFRTPFSFKLLDARINVNDAPTGASILVDINNGANSALSSALEIATSSFTSSGTASINSTYEDFTDDSQVTIDIDQVGSTNPGRGLKIWLYTQKL